MYYCKQNLASEGFVVLTFKILYNSRIVVLYIYTVADAQLKVSKK